MDADNETEGERWREGDISIEVDRGEGRRVFQQSCREWKETSLTQKTQKERQRGRGTQTQTKRETERQKKKKKERQRDRDSI